MSANSGVSFAKGNTNPAQSSINQSNAPVGRDEEQMTALIHGERALWFANYIVEKAVEGGAEKNTLLKEIGGSMEKAQTAANKTLEALQQQKPQEALENNVLAIEAANEVIEKTMQIIKDKTLLTYQSLESFDRSIPKR